MILICPMKIFSFGLAAIAFIASIASIASIAFIAPIVVIAVGDPVTTGLVESLRRPEGNLTGLSAMSPELVGKTLELLKDTLPELNRIAILWQPLRTGVKQPALALSLTFLYLLSTAVIVYLFGRPHWTEWFHAAFFAAYAVLYARGEKQCLRN